jgi:site-specific recombinase XerD
MNPLLKNAPTLQRIHEGPLGQHIDSYAAEIRTGGFAEPSAKRQIAVIVDFGHWLATRRINAQDITPKHFQPYLRSGARYRVRDGDLAALKRLWNLLRRQGVIPEPSMPAATPLDRLQDEFHLYLRQERALASTTMSYYLSFAREFLAEHFDDGPVDLASLCAADVTGFVGRRAASLVHSKRVQQMTTSLRSFLRFARYRGDLNTDLAACVPAVASWSLSTVPKALPPAQVELVVASCDRQTAVGRRDYGILLLLARLGLRAGEVATLSLEDLDWQAGLITVRGKGGRYSQLPLPVDVGEAIADYLRHGRPRSASRSVFLRVKAPKVSFKGQEAIGSVVKHALARAGLDTPRKGAHQFRHGLASQMLRQGASLAEIGEVLRHRNPQTTTIYAKVDLASLATVALPWPGGVQ